MRPNDLRFAICDRQPQRTSCTNPELKMPAACCRSRIARHGLSLVELMISLAITAMLLTAVAAAYSASASAIEVNERFFRATQAARVSMHQLVTDIRRCDSVTVADNRIEVWRPLELLPDDGSELSRIYTYDPVEQKLILNIVDVEDNVSPNYVIARNVVAARFVPELRPEVVNGAPTGVNIVFRVTIELNVRVDTNTIRLSGSAVPRKAMIY
jgi:prepilin-type N-terminal cleavage/methylation domain-containing protein